MNNAIIKCPGDNGSKGGWTVNTSEITIKRFSKETLVKGEICICTGEIRVIVKGAVKSGTTLVSEWMDTGLPGTAYSLTITPKNTDPLNEEEGSGIITYGKEDLFEKAGFTSQVPEIKMGYQLAERTGKFRLALKFKGSYEGGVFALHYVAEGSNKDRSNMETDQPLLPLTEMVEGKNEEVKVPASEMPVSETPVTAEHVTEVPTSSTAVEEFYIANPPKLLHPNWRYVLRTNVDQSVNPVEWSVDEGCGEINGYGEYHAPQRAGMYEVRAKLLKDGREATAFIIVRN